MTLIDLAVLCLEVPEVSAVEGCLLFPSFHFKNSATFSASPRAAEVQDPVEVEEEAVVVVVAAVARFLLPLLLQNVPVALDQGHTYFPMTGTATVTTIADLLAEISIDRESTGNVMVVIVIGMVPNWVLLMEVVEALVLVLALVLEVGLVGPSAHLPLADLIVIPTVLTGQAEVLVSEEEIVTITVPLLERPWVAVVVV